jgi:predicted secreted hydrolase
MTEMRAWMLLSLIAVAGCNEPAPTRPDAPSAGPAGVRYLAGGDESADGFARALVPRTFEFPADHSSHPAFRTEWWYFTGNVADRNDRHYGFELTLFRIALAPAAAPRESPLATSSVWMGNLAITDTTRQRFLAAERLSRGAAGLAGTAAANLNGTAGVSVSVEDWTITLAGDEARLDASDANFGIALDLTGLTRIVAQGDGGLDSKGPEPGNASYYFSAPRMHVSGELWSGSDARAAVTGTAWMDREWSTSALSRDLAGWDWFALQLDDGRNLMFYRLRRPDGSTSPFSGGTLSDERGNVVRLDAGALELTVTDEWTSRASGVRYPVAWHLELPAESLTLDVRPRLENQELDLSVRYWEGAVSVEGSAAGRDVRGVGYLELAGY